MQNHPAAHGICVTATDFLTTIGQPVMHDLSLLFVPFFPLYCQSLNKALFLQYVSLTGFSEAQY